MPKTHNNKLLLASCVLSSLVNLLSTGVFIWYCWHLLELFYTSGMEVTFLIWCNKETFTLKLFWEICADVEIILLRSVSYSIQVCEFASRHLVLDRDCSFHWTLKEDNALTLAFWGLHFFTYVLFLTSAILFQGGWKSWL